MTHVAERHWTFFRVDDPTSNVDDLGGTVGFAGVRIDNQFIASQRNRPLASAGQRQVGYCAFADDFFLGGFDFALGFRQELVLASAFRFALITFCVGLVEETRVPGRQTITVVRSLFVFGARAWIALHRSWMSGTQWLQIARHVHGRKERWKKEGNSKKINEKKRKEKNKYSYIFEA